MGTRNIDMYYATFTINSYNISAKQTSGGTISLSESGLLVYGTPIVVNVAPALHYRLDRLYYTNSKQTVDITNSKQFTVPSADTIVRADWVQYQYQAIINQTSGGTISINGNTGTQYIDVGTTIEVYVTPNVDYKLVKLIANDGSETDITNSLKYTMKSHDVTFTAT